MIKIAFFEDHPIVINSLKQLIESNENFELIFYATTKASLFEKLIQNNNIDVIIIDLLANDVKGLELFEFVCEKYSDIKTIAFTTMSSPILIENLLKIGIKGYVNKCQELEDLVEAIVKANNNVIYLPEDYDFLLKNYESKNNLKLTLREIEIMQLIMKEYSTQDIAKYLGISVSTVENHRWNIFTKLNVKNAVGMAREASKLGF